MPLDKMWTLSQAWYGDRLDPTYAPKPVEAMQQMLDDVGLQESFWSLTNDPDR